MSIERYRNIKKKTRIGTIIFRHRDQIQLRYEHSGIAYWYTRDQFNKLFEKIKE